MIGIITTAYNASTFIKKTIDSVLAQSITDWEYIIVDDGSKDDTFEFVSEVAKQDPRIRPFKIENRGTPGARNYGYAQASTKSEYAIFLDHDDTWNPDTLE